MWIETINMGSPWFKVFCWAYPAMARRLRALNTVEWYLGYGWTIGFNEGKLGASKN